MSDDGLMRMLRNARDDARIANAKLGAACAALERAANDLMLSEESFVTMRAKRDEVLSELHAKSAALEHANRFLEQETFTRQKYGDQLHATEAALERAQTQVALYEGRHPAQLGPDGREMSPRHRFTGDGICIRCGSDVESDTGCVEELRAALDRAANDLMLSEESFVTMRAKRDDVLSELRTTRAALSARDHAVDLAGINAEAANELERRAERAEAALADKQRVCDGLVAAIENNQEIDEEHCRELDAARAALEQLQDALSVRDHQYLAAWGQLVASRAALERARALVERWAAKKYAGDLTTAVYHGCAEELAAALLAAASGGAA